MANASKRKYSRNFCVGVRIEIPNKFLGNIDIMSVYKKNKSICIHDYCHGGNIVPRHVKDLLLAKNDGADGLSSNFSILINFGNDLMKVERVAKIMNILGDDRLFKEKVKTFVIGKSVLNAIPELAGLKQAFLMLETLIPKFTEVAWLSAPDAKLR
jgi:hypothetical protein